MKINELVKAVHENAVEHGWWEQDRSFGELIALCHSELSEALEEYRKGKLFFETYYSGKSVSRADSQGFTSTIVYTSEKPRKDLPIEKPEGIPSELADVVIRIMDMCGRYGIDLEKAILEKHEYNKTRPYKHGGKKI